MYRQGYYKSKIYNHHPHTEKDLFSDSLIEYIEKIKNESIVGVEIGVLNGDTSKFLLNINDKINLIGIDPIIIDSMNHTLIGSLDRIKQNTINFGDRFKFIHNYSQNVVNEIPNNIDFIFIDGSHHYEDVKLDYELYSSKVKLGGLIYFHDSRMNRGGADFHVGSSRLVDEIIENDKKIELIGEAFSLTCFLKKSE